MQQFLHPATRRLEEEEQRDIILLVDDVAGDSETAEGIKKKVQSVLELRRKNKITLNPAKFCVSRKIEVCSFEISSDDTDPNPMMRHTKLAVKKVLDFPEPECKKDIQKFVGLMNTLCHWSNKLSASCLDIRSIAGTQCGIGMPFTKKNSRR